MNNNNKKPDINKKDEVEHKLWEPEMAATPDVGTPSLRALFILTAVNVWETVVRRNHEWKFE